MLSNHLILCCFFPLLLSIFPSIRVFSKELAFCIRWPKYWSFNFSISSVQSLIHVQLFSTPWTAAHQACLSITNYRSLLKLMSIESVMSSNLFIFCHPLLIPPSIIPRIRVFPVTQFFSSGGQSIGVSTSPSVLPMNIQD